MGFIDCDAHVIESAATWDYLDPNERHFRPAVVTFEDDVKGARFGVGFGAFWVSVRGDSWSRYMPVDGDVRGNANIFDSSSTLLTDTSARIADLDALGIDVQVLISTIFIAFELTNPLEEAALTRSYNRWIADAVADSGGRLRWLVRPPLRIMDRALKELEFAKAHGAVGIHLRGLEHGYYLSDSYFDPLYAKAQDLELAIVIHLGAATPGVDKLPFGQTLPRPEALTGHLCTAMTGFHSVISGDITEKFPRLRWAIAEAGASWVPAALQMQTRLRASGGEFLKLRRITSEELEHRNIFVACESDEDLPYLIRRLGENVLIAGTDYCHNDTGSELAVHRSILERTDIRHAAARSIVSDNGRKLFGIDPEFTPAPKFRGGMVALPFVHGAKSEDGRPLVKAVFEE